MNCNFRINSINWILSPPLRSQLEPLSRSEISRAVFENLIHADKNQQNGTRHVDILALLLLDLVFFHHSALNAFCN